MAYKPKRKITRPVGSSAEYHESRLLHLFPKMSREDAKRLGKDLEGY